MAFDLKSYLVNDIVMRQDKEAVLIKHLYLAAHQYHSSGFYRKDLLENYVTAVTPTDRSYPIQIALPINFRKWEYIRFRDQAGRLGKNLKRIEATDIFQHFDNSISNLHKVGVYYNAGLNVNIYMNEAVQGFLLGYYCNMVNQPNFWETDWLCQQFPLAVCHKAAAMFYISTENESLARVQNALAAEHISMLPFETLEATE